MDILCLNHMVSMSQIIITGSNGGGNTKRVDTSEVYIHNYYEGIYKIPS